MNGGACVAMQCMTGLLHFVGQTGSGKTHTMQGLPHDRGVNFRALEDLFRLVAIRAPETDYEICVSLVEVGHLSPHLTNLCS